jgi:hypothetical protein
VLVVAVTEQATQDFKDKVALEGELQEELDEFNKELLLAFLLLLGTSGNVLNTDTFDDRLQEILLTHYGKVSEEFSHRVSPTLPEDLQTTGEEGTSIAVALSLFALIRAGAQSQIILNTATTELLSAVANAEQIALAEQALGNDMSQQEIATTAAATASRALRARTPTIACTETQVIAEVSKATEVAVLAGQTPPTVAGSSITTGVTKEWVTVRDNKVRRNGFNHVAADRQKVDVNGVYVVSGQQLRWPGDIGLGASLGNVINCRCSSIADSEDLLQVRLTRQQQAF